MEGNWSKEIKGISFPSIERGHLKSSTIYQSPGMGKTHRKMRCKHIMDQGLKEENPSPTSQITNTITYVTNVCFFKTSHEHGLFSFHVQKNNEYQLTRAGRKRTNFDISGNEP